MEHEPPNDRLRAAIDSVTPGEVAAHLQSADPELFASILVDIGRTKTAVAGYIEAEAKK